MRKDVENILQNFPKFSARTRDAHTAPSHVCTRLPNACVTNMWARQKNEWWPAEVASVSEDGMLCVSFVGWDSRHNVWMDPPKADDADPQLVFEPPAARRRAPERLFDEVQAQGPRMAVESKPNPRRSSSLPEQPKSHAGPGTPGTGERSQLALKRQRTSALTGTVRVVEGAHVGATGDVLDAASGYYRVVLHGPGGNVGHFRSSQLVGGPPRPSPLAAPRSAKSGARGSRDAPSAPPPRPTVPAVAPAAAGAGCSRCRWSRAGCSRCNRRRQLLQAMEQTVMPADDPAATAAMPAGGGGGGTSHASASTAASTHVAATAPAAASHAGAASPISTEPAAATFHVSPGLPTTSAARRASASATAASNTTATPLATPLPTATLSTSIMDGTLSRM